MKVFIARMEGGGLIGFVENNRVVLSDKKLESALQEAIESKKKLQYVTGREEKGLYYTQNLFIFPTLTNLKRYVETFLYQYPCRDGLYRIASLKQILGDF